jgi:aryl-alcohol dehydrogenase-like predicted oxidoreductase
MEKPSNQAKLDAVEELALLAENAGISLIHLALAFTLAHPAVNATIIGPRTMEQLESQLGATDVTLSNDLLDRIDKIVPPGVTLNPDADSGHVPPALREPFLRRRRIA